MPAASQFPKNLRKQIGPAVWLLALLVRFTPAEWIGNEASYVAGGNVVADAELAERLGVSERTISGWRRRLRRAGLIGWLSARGQGRAFWLAPLNLIFGVASRESAVEQKPAQEPAAKAETALAAPAATRWLQ
jgi:transposase-like protein